MVGYVITILVLLLSAFGAWVQLKKGGDRLEQMSSYASAAICLLSVAALVIQILADIKNSKENAVIRSAALGRKIDPDTRANTLKALSAFKDLKVGVSYYNDDPECVALAQQVVDLFKEAGVDVKIASRIFMGIKPGIAINFPKKHEGRIVELANILKAAVQQTSPLHASYKEEMKGFDIEVVVGPKPSVSAE